MNPKFMISEDEAVLCLYVEKAKCWILNTFMIALSLKAFPADHEILVTSFHYKNWKFSSRYFIQVQIRKLLIKSLLVSRIMHCPSYKYCYKNTRGQIRLSISGRMSSCFVSHYTHCTNPPIANTCEIHCIADKTCSHAVIKLHFRQTDGPESLISKSVICRRH